MNQKFCNILVICGTIWRHQMILPRSLRWPTTLDCEKQNLPDTLQVLLTEFTSMANLTLPDLQSSCKSKKKNSWTIWLLFWDQLWIHFLHKHLRLLLRTALWPSSEIVPKLDYVAYLSMKLSNHTQSEAIDNVSAHRLPQYYQPQQMALVMWYPYCKLSWTKILQNIWLTLLQMMIYWKLSR